MCLFTALNLDRVEIHGFTIGTALDTLNSTDEIKTIIAGVSAYRSIIANRGFPQSANHANATTKYTTVDFIGQGSTIEQSTSRHSMDFSNTINSIDSTPVSRNPNIINTEPPIATNTVSTKTSVETTGTRQTSPTSENNKHGENGNSSQSSFISLSLIILLLFCYSM